MTLWVRLGLAAGVIGGLGFALHTTTRVGDTGPRGTFVTSNQWVKPEGKVTTLPGRILDVAWMRSGHVLAKSTGALIEIDPRTGKAVQTLAAAGGGSMHGLLVDREGTLALFANASNRILVARRKDKWEWEAPVELASTAIAGAPYPLGMTWLEEGRTAAVCLSRSGEVVVIDIPGRKIVKRITVDICPYGIAASQDKKSLFVSCWSRKPRPGEETQESSGVKVPVLPSGVARNGTLLKISVDAGRVEKRAAIGLQPTEVATGGGYVYVACANSDTVLKLRASDLGLAAKADFRREMAIPFGTAPNSVALSRDGRTLAVGCGGVNGVALLDASTLKTRGWIPTAWYAGGVALGDRGLAAASIKGFGSRSAANEDRKDAYDWTTTVQTLPIPTGGRLAAMTRAFEADLDAQAMREAGRVRKRTSIPVPVPANLGEPSVFRHVVYILKENRTYDQIYGDMPQGKGRKDLCLFPREVTPNHHALAEEFGLLDNFYCNGVLSADGHAWSMEGQPTSYFERSFGGWARSYPFGDDPLAVSEKGYLWDDMVARGITFRNFGEFDYAEPSKGESFSQIYDDFISGERKIKFTHKIGVARLRKYTAPNYPGWNMKIPDVLRAEEFRKEFVEMEKKGVMPQFTIIYLPQDHHSGDQVGMPTPRAHVADNDLAMGRVVELLMKSRFWKNMVIFVNEDDPGGGFDHVDGHRSVGLVISRWSRKGVNSSFHSQASMLATMRRILGLPPLTQADARAPLMDDCFSSQPTDRSFAHLTPSVPLNELNKAPSEVRGSIDLSGPDRADDNLLARKMWAVMRPGQRFPQEVTGFHGRGLKQRGLALSGEDED